jgi:hypothetical protein
VCNPIRLNERLARAQDRYVACTDNAARAPVIGSLCRDDAIAQWALYRPGSIMQFVVCSAFIAGDISWLLNYPALAKVRSIIW